MLSLQDKLALALTSAGSQRKLAALVGVSHQKIGRWLREGVPATIDPETGYLIKSAGVKSIPKEAAPLIDTAFRIHISVTKDQAKADGIPFNSNFPAFAERKLLKTRQKGDRVVIENTEFINPDLRAKVIEGAQQSKKYLQVSVRSKVNLVKYFQRGAADEIKQYDRKYETVKGLGKKILDSFLARQNKILPTDQIQPIYTKYENISKDSRAGAVRGVAKKLRAKHESSAVSLADEILFQVDNRRQTNVRAKPASKAKASAKTKGTPVKSRKR